MFKRSFHSRCVASQNTSWIHLNAEFTVVIILQDGDIYCIGVTSLGFVSNDNDATVTLTRCIKVSLAHICIWTAPLGHCKGMLGNKLECIFLIKELGQNGNAFKQEWARIGLRDSNY